MSEPNVNDNPSNSRYFGLDRSGGLTDRSCHPYSHAIVFLRVFQFMALIVNTFVKTGDSLHYNLY